MENIILDILVESADFGDRFVDYGPREDCGSTVKQPITIDGVVFMVTVERQT